ncbi:DegQ family serine endoprotease [Novispirillum sp. DQ9]|uniref:DegQ family serine endoprotease n=1 Tax=Novispirillum sp. DQ9 TaxID=3398612 RepID=UPI003C7DE2DF
MAVAAMLAAGAAHARGTPEGFADLAERLQPAVVNVSTTQTISAERGPEMPQFPPGSPFEEFFKDFFDRHGNGGAPNGAPLPPRRATSLGSGFIVDPSGLVVTNNHVIQDADEISIILQDDTVLQAELVGRDSKTDLALLRVKTDRKLPYVQFGDSDAARVGDWVMAIGNPFGLGGSVTAGIISAKTRDIQAGPYDSFIQTDASINRGNSGGPLFNMRGEVIGINTAIFSPTGGSVGIGFAVPANLAKQVLADLKEYGRTRRGWLGVRIQSVTDEIAESLGMKSSQGALVASVQPDSPAQAAGIRPGDVITAFNNSPVTEMRRLPAIVAETEIGKTVPVSVWRDGRAQTLEVTVAEMEEEEEQAAAEAPPPRSGTEQTAIAPLGLSVTPLTPELRERFGLEEGARGVVVTTVATNGPAAEKGISAGDVVVEVNQTPVSSAQEIRQQLDKAKEAGRRSVLLLVQSSAGMRFVAINVTEG